MEDSSDKSFLRFYQQLQIQRQSVSNGTIMLVMQCVSNAGFVVENVFIFVYMCAFATRNKERLLRNFNEINFEKPNYGNK